VFAGSHQGCVDRRKVLVAPRLCRQTWRDRRFPHARPIQQPTPLSSCRIRMTTRLGVSFQLPVVKSAARNAQTPVMMARIAVVLLLAKLRIGTGQFLEIPMLRGKILVRHIQPTPLLVLFATICSFHNAHLRTHGANAKASHPHSSPSSHRDFGSLLNRLASAIC
jgi:hypothetical protein